MESVTVTPKDVWVGRNPKSNHEVIAIGVTCSKFTPLGRVKATGKLNVWDPTATDGTEKAIRLAATEIDTTAAEASKAVYFSGDIVSEAVEWPTATDAQKMGAFDGSQIILDTLA